MTEAAACSSDVPIPTEVQPPGTRTQPQPFAAVAPDGYAVRGFTWRHADRSEQPRPAVVINPATSVACRYYFRFAKFLWEAGFDVVTYDYRGIGVSRPSELAGFDACWIDWGRLDFEAILLYTARTFPGQPIHIVAHSVGGFLVGMAESNRLIQKVFTVGAQFAYWRDYAAKARLRMFAKWHMAMPLITMMYGYFPGKRLGWLEDTPAGVVRDWACSRKRFEHTWRGMAALRYPDPNALVRQFEAITAPILAVSLTDDEFGTVPAIERLLSYFSESAKCHLRISPDAVGEAKIGHFGFFDSRYQNTLWDLPLEWLKTGRLPSQFPGLIVPRKGHTA